MAALSLRPEHRDALRARLAGEAPLLVVALCAAWCRTCGEFGATFATLARERPDALFVWLDIEDDAALVDDLDVEGFPTLAVYRGDAPVHFGVSLPQPGIVARLLDALAIAEPAAAPLEAVRRLPQRLRAQLA